MADGSVCATGGGVGVFAIDEVMEGVGEGGEVFRPEALVLGNAGVAAESADEVVDLPEPLINIFLINIFLIGGGRSGLVVALVIALVAELAEVESGALCDLEELDIGGQLARGFVMVGLAVTVALAGALELLG